MAPQEERADRERAAEAAEAAERRRRIIGRGLGYALAIGALAAFAIGISALSGGTGTGAGPSPEDFPQGSVPPRQITDLRQAADAADCTIRSFEDEGRRHVGDDPSYRSSPPHSGDHARTPAEDGAYSEAPRTGAVVHALEHGRVAYWFRPGASARLRGALKALFDEDDRHVLLVPADAGMPFEVAASAWRKVLGCPDVTRDSVDALRAFRDAYRDQGPESVP